MIRISLFLPLFAFVLSGCVSFQNPVPEGYSGTTATVTDTFTNHKGSTAHFFVLTKVNGNLTEDSGYRTRVTNTGRGFNMTPDMVTRPITTEEQTLTIAGFVQFATDGQGMFGDHMLVQGDIRLIPKPNETYRITGELSKEGSSVWLEDSSGNQIGEKIHEDE